jgi:phosphatidylserine/phosphatidylglycerophosphate/cardiolipin synthase-like enzyme
MIKQLVSPWNDTFESLLTQASKSLLICSPYVGRGPCERLASTLRRRGMLQLPLLLLTDLSRDNMLSGSTDVSALAGLYAVLPHMEVRFLRNLHAKVYIADEQCAVVTSANLTDAGLCRNFEYGLYIHDPSVVKEVTADVTQYALLGSVINLSQLRQFETVIAELRALKEEIEKRLQARLRKEFDRKMQAADEAILRVRAEGLTSHAAFADTLLYLLKQGPKDTKTLYSAVQTIHPDLCDDTVKLVIKGEEWSQVKWHHRVRHAQLFLSRQGRIKREGSKWHFVQ